MCQGLYLITYLLMTPILPVLPVVVMLAIVVVNILFASAFYQAKRQYESLL